MSDRRFLALLQLFYQGLSLITAGLRKMIDEMKAEAGK